jgi:hypothetical protein
MKRVLLIIVIVSFSFKLHSQCNSLILEINYSNPNTNSVLISWTSGIEIPDSWAIELTNVTQGKNQEFTGINPVSNQYLISNLGLGNEYSLKMKGLCEIDGATIGGEWSKSIQFFLPNNNCVIPTNIHVQETSISNNSAEIIWDFDTEDAYGYEISWGKKGYNPNFGGGHLLIEKLVNGVDLIYLQQNTEYDLYIRSLCNNGKGISYSNWSENISFITQKGVNIPTYSGDPNYLKSNCCRSFNLFSEIQNTSKYIISAWVKEDHIYEKVPTYLNSGIALSITQEQGNNVVGDIIGIFYPEGNIIEGWQRIEGIFEIRPEIEIEKYLSIDLFNDSGVDVYFDDIRIYPYNGSMKSFVYDDVSKRLMSELDENNYATFYEYDMEGGLIRVKKETEKGVYTIQETRSSNVKNSQDNE